MRKNVDPFDRVITGFATATGQINAAGNSPDESETVLALIDSTRRFGERHVDSARIDAESKIPQAVLQAAGELGLFGLTIAPAFGGAGLSMKATARVIETLSSFDRSLGVAIGLHNGLGLRSLNALGTPEQKARFLPQLATGAHIACFAATEPGAGSDIASLKTTAVRDGDHLLLTGEKIYVTNGGFASIATIVARTPGQDGSQRGHSLLLVPLDLPGIERGRKENTLGIHGSSTCSIRFEDVKIPRDQILGTPCRGLDHLAHVLTWGRTLMAGGCVGMARAAYDKAVAQVTLRVQFNRKIAEFGMVREKIARMRSRIYAMESLARLVTWLEDERPDSIGWESSVAKIFCSEGAWFVADETVQVHGGSGFIEDTGVAMLLRDVRIARIFEGANEVLRGHLAAAAFTWDLTPREDGPSLAATLGAGHPLSEPARDFDSHRQKAEEVLRVQKKQHGLKVFQRQITQRSLADALHLLYVQLAVIARAAGALRQDKLDDLSLLCAQHAAAELSGQIDRALYELDHPHDELSSRLAAAECARVDAPLTQKVS